MSASVLPWHARAWNDLTERAASGRLAHALLLDGPGGWGKGWLARQFARHLLGMELALLGGASHSPDESDRDLRTHPDARIVCCEVAESTGRRRTQITVDQVRELGEFLVRTAGAGSRRVVVLERAEDLNANAANALLKRLEEPGVDTHLLLVSDRVARVLPTIRSRCQRMTCPPGSADEAKAWMAAAGDRVAAEDADVLMRMAGGAPLRALALADSDVPALHREVADVLAGAAPDALMTPVPRADAEATRERALLILEITWTLLTEQARGETRGDVARRTHVQIERVQRARQRLLSTANPNVQMLLEDLFLGALRAGA